MGEELLIKKVVDNLVEKTNELKQTESISNTDNFRKILPTLLERGLDNINLEATATIIPCLGMSALIVLTSGQEIMAFGHSSIPLIIALTLVLLNDGGADRISRKDRALPIVCVFLPFGLILAQHDYRWTYFDSRLYSNRNHNCNRHQNNPQQTPGYLSGHAFITRWTHFLYRDAVGRRKHSRNLVEP